MLFLKFFQYFFRKCVFQYVRFKKYYNFYDLQFTLRVNKIPRSELPEKYDRGGGESLRISFLEAVYGFRCRF